ncbi:type VI secretion protein IcmF/TssM N-terminal domain-containing protein [Sorangium sp. So ce1024]|uniref:type VI secretion protein IcmF/TssM N-terminal domain-containing protein n=1 Tax=Sorangium sp. So ce1024 TaxID=3133327 RepID=UPI003F08FFC5
MSWWLAAALALLAAALVALGLFLRARRRRRAPAGAAADADVSREMKRLLAAARAALGPSPEEVPCFLVLGAPGAGKSTLLAGAGLRARPGAAARPLGAAATCQVWPFERAVFVEPAGGLLVGEPQGAATPHASGFRALLEAMRRARPERPVDGVLVALSARDLLDDEGAAPGHRRQIALVRQRLDEAQRLLGMHVPVHLAVTQCDRLPGFDRFARELDADLRQATLGWAQPGAPSAVESTADLVDEAMSSVGASLSTLQARRFASDRPFAEGAEPYFLFPEALASLRQPLRGAVEELLRAQEGGEPVAVRSLSWVGLEGPEPAQAGAPAQGPAARRALFARDLLERKVIAEASLARPTALAVRRRRNVLRALNWATVAGALLYSVFLALESNRLERHTASLLPFLRDLASDLRQMALEDPSADPSGTARRERSVRLLQGLGAIETERLRSVILPGSWLSGVDARVVRAIEAAYERVILDAFRAGLEARTSPLLAEATPLPQGAEVAAATLERTPEYAALEAWLRDVAAFEGQVARFDALAAGPPKEPSTEIGEARVLSVVDLAESLFQHRSLPPRTTAYQRRALLAVPPLLPFGLDAYRDPARAKADRLFGQLFQRMSRTLDEAALREDVIALVRGLEALERGGPDYTTESLAALHDVITRTEARLAAPTLSWVAADKLPPNPALDRLLDAVRASRLLGAQAYGVVKDDGEGRLLLLKRYLGDAEAALSGPLLVRKEGVVQLQLSPVVARLKDPSAALLRQRFMTPADASDPVPASLDDARLSWNLEELKEGAKLLKDYEAFAQDGGLKPFPERVRGTLEDLARRNLRDSVLVAVGKAARREMAPSPSESRRVETVRADVASLSLAGEPLREILAAAGRLGLEEVRDRVRRLVRGQGARLLTLASRALEADGLYEVKNGTFLWWNGERSPAFEAFGVAEGDGAQLAEYVVAQRGRADALARALAEPVLALMESAEVGADAPSVGSMAPWQSIAGALRDYEGKKAGNSVAALERFLLTDLPAITFETCIAQLERVPVDVRSDDYFARRRRRILVLLRDRCATLAEDEIRTKYPTLRRAFHRSLADRFPFARLDPGVEREDADPDDVRLFLQSASEFRRRFRPVLSLRGGAAARAVVRFLDRTEKVREFLAPMWAQGDATMDGSYDVTVGFRVNQAREVAGNQIAEWSLRVAEERLSLGGPKPTATWRLGDPVQLALRWAKNSPDIPSLEQGAGALARERTVIFEERGPWSLLRLIAKHTNAVEEAELRKEDAAANLLQLVVFTIPDPAGGWVERVGATGGVARVFVRLGLVGKEKDKPLKYPDFPTAAPALDAE